MPVKVPPIKCQGIKTKLVDLIQRSVNWDQKGTWHEPFMGSGVVGFNIRPEKAVFADTNPHLIKFYEAIRTGAIDALTVREYLEAEGQELALRGVEYYLEVRSRFNINHEPLDFLFLNRSCFNGMIRFNRSGGFNVPFGHKPKRFAKAYVTKIVNQVKYVSSVSRSSDWKFICQDFSRTLSIVRSGDFVYCDPPYVGRHVDYYDSWEEEMEQALFASLTSLDCRFILSTWHSNQHRENSYLQTLWSMYHVLTKEHFYHLGAKEANRKPMLEALVMNYVPVTASETPVKRSQQTALFEGEGNARL